MNESINNQSAGRRLFAFDEEGQAKLEKGGNDKK